MGAARKSWKTYALGAAAVAALLSSTACQPGGGSDDGAAGTPPSGSASATTGSEQPSTPGATETTEPTEPSESAAPPVATDSATPGGGDGDGGGTAAARACVDDDLSYDTSYWPRDSGQHLLLTATNNSDKPCTLYHYPFVYFGQETENPLGPMESKPTAIATIGPKEKAYAGMKLFLGGEKTVTYESFGLALANPKQTEQGAALDIALSDEVKFVTVGPNPSVTFWNRDRREVEKYVFKAR
ncbi:DUF4232 domain-containing protein [Streptomyces sp. NPDC058659]|uniref:DUF4232 domain-containing protein n=1 Tax=unclassified Streptomyces TaxID=2593676 RepID=UPI003658F5C6